MRFDILHHLSIELSWVFWATAWVMRFDIHVHTFPPLKNSPSFKYWTVVMRFDVHVHTFPPLRNSPSFKYWIVVSILGYRLVFRYATTLLVSYVYQIRYRPGSWRLYSFIACVVHVHRVWHDHSHAKWCYVGLTRLKGLKTVEAFLLEENIIMLNILIVYKDKVHVNKAACMHTIINIALISRLHYDALFVGNTSWKWNIWLC